ncbi:MAG: hypothetical protein ABID09_02045 [Candidatus Omnitrophota bacterium]
MNKVQNRKIKRLNNNNLFSLFEEHVKRSITEDLREIYDKEIRLLDSDSDEPWVYSIPKK